MDANDDTVPEDFPAPTPAPAMATGFLTTPDLPLAPPASRASRRAVVGWSVGSTLVAVLIAGGIVTHVSANRAFDAAVAQLDTAIAKTEDTAAATADVVEKATGFTDSATYISESAADDLVDPAARTAFVASTDALDTAAAAAEDLLAEPLGPFDAEKPFWTWEVFAGIPVLEADADDVTAAGDALEGAAVAVDAADAALSDAARAMYATVTAPASALEAANVSARTDAVLDFRDAAVDAAAQTTAGPGAAQAFALYAQRAADLKSSAESELAEKNGPLLATRLEIEAYARSLSGGVVLDFDWAPIVNGVGGRTGMGGTATWNTARGGFSTITLSNSVAEQWPDPDARALVAHEVGHSITSKCSAMFDSENQAANEEWATAWAISMGHTAEGNGVQAYGYPSQDMIDRAAGCR